MTGEECVRVSVLLSRIYSNCCGFSSETLCNLLYFCVFDVLCWKSDRRCQDKVQTLKQLSESKVEMIEMQSKGTFILDLHNKLQIYGYHDINL